MDESHDPNDTRQISFLLDEAEVDWINEKLEQLKKHDPGFYVRIIGIGDTKYLYKITTQQKILNAMMERNSFSCLSYGSAQN